MQAAVRSTPEAPARDHAQAKANVFLSAPAITLSWILRLRWGAVAGQTLTIALATLALHLSLPLVPLAALVGVTALSNVALLYVVRTRPASISPHLVAGVLAADTLVLCGLLYFTGGPSNPFSVLYLVQVTLAALVLGMRWAAALVALSAASYAFLFFANVPLAGMEHMHHGGSAFALHLQGMWAAFTLAAGLIAFFVTRLARALRERDEQLAAAQERAARNEKLASLSTLAAGAAHELGTPLATIAVAAKELARGAEALRGDAAEALREDARLIREEVDRCRDIVQQMSARAGESLGEAPERVRLAAIGAAVRARLPEDRRALFDAEYTDPELVLVTPARGLAQALASLVKNAFEASAEGARVSLHAAQDGSSVRFVVSDTGSGIPAAQLARIGEPFFTTKPPGSGMGLGVFLARAFVERLGGRFEIESAPGRGTRVTLLVPQLPRAPHTMRIHGSA